MTPSGELTLADLMLQLGIRVGSRDQDGAGGRFSIPADANARQLLLDAINSGRRELYSRMPDARVFEPTVTFTMDPAGAAADVIDSDPSKYRLAYNVEGFAGGQFEWSAVDSDGEPTGFGNIIRQCHQSDLQALHTSTATAQTTSWPRAVALVRTMLGNPADPGRKVVDYLWVYPKPDQAYIIRGQVRIGYGQLTEMDDLEPMGQQHIESVLTFAERQYKIGRMSTDEAQLIEARCDKAVEISQSLDGVRGPQDLGVNIDPDAERDRRRYGRGGGPPSTWSQVSEVSGQAV